MLSSAFVLTGAIMYATRWMYATYFFAVGAAGITFCYMTVSQTNHFRLRRLNRMNVFAGILMVVAAVFMYLLRNEWIIFLLIAAVLQLYTSIAGRYVK